MRLCSSLALLLCLLLTAAPAALSRDKERRDLDERRERQRQLFLDDRLPAESLQRMAETPCVDGFAGSYPCNNVDLLAFLPLSTIGGGSGNDIWGWTDPLTGREYALMGRSSGTSFVDITDPVNPIYLGNLPGRGSASSWRDLKVYADHVYVVSESFGHGMQVFDLTGLRDVVAPPVTFDETAHYDDFGSAHNIAINEESGYAYSVGTGTCSGGPHFIDLADPAAPVFAGCFIETIYTHDTQCIVYSGPDVAYQGREVCFNSNENKFNIVDVSDKGATSLISSTVYSGTAYTHQGWLTEDQQYWLLGDELDEQNQGHPTRTRIFDVRDLDAPVLIGTYDGVTNAVDHNLYTHNGYAYEANYRAGLQILDLADVANGNLTQVANFDIYPSSDSANFNGAWSVYPYFESGTVIVSGIEQGLFIVRPTLSPDFRVDADTETLAICDPGMAQAALTLTDRNDYVGSVSFTAVDLPIGAQASFDDDPLAVPGSTTMTVTTSGVAPGSYAFKAQATDGTLTNDRELTLEVADAVAALPTLSLPADGAIDVSRAPMLEWAPASQAFSYAYELATDPDFTDVVLAGQTTITSLLVAEALSPLTTYYWRVSASNACGSSLASAAASFTTLDIPPILLVDDDDNSPDVVSSYVELLTALGEDFDLWDTENSDAEPNAATLAPYETVIWFTGDEFGGASGPGGGGESALAAWLDEIGCLLIASQDYYYDRSLTGFMQSHLGLASATSDVSQSSATGAGSVFGALGSFGLSFPYTNYTDTLVPDATAEVAFVGSAGDAAIDKDSGVYRSAFWSFGLEGLPEGADRQLALTTFLDWCDGLDQADADTDGTTNGDDCAPTDAAVWRAPGEASALTVGLADLQWSAPVTPGATAVAYDVLRTGDVADFAAGSCIEGAVLDTASTDPALPAAGELYAYLIRVSNACGQSMGAGTDAAPRGGVTCP